MSSAAQPSDIPAEFYFSIGGFMAETHKLTLRSSGLLYTREMMGVPLAKEHLEPSRKAWIAFWEAVGHTKVWEWLPNYDGEILDGTQWELVLSHGGKHVRSSGSNAFPGCPDCNYTLSSPFGRFLCALRRLTGKRIK